MAGAAAHEEEAARDRGDYMRVYRAIEIRGDVLKMSAMLQRPQDTDFDEILVLDWEAAGIVIPWLAGMTPKEAVLAWAKAQG